MLVPVSQPLCICHKGTTLCLQLAVPVINDALHILSLAQHAQQVSMTLGIREKSDDPYNVHLSEGANMLDQGLSFTLICEGGCKGAGGPAPAGWLDAAGAVEAGVEPPAYPHGAYLCHF